MAGLAVHVAVVSRVVETAGRKLEEEKEEVATPASAGSQVPCSGTLAADGGGLVGLEVMGPLVEPVRSEGEKGDAVGVVATGAPAVGALGGLVLTEEGEDEEEEEGVVQVEEGEKCRVDVAGASSESAVTGINHRSPLRVHHCSSSSSHQHAEPPGALKQKTPNFLLGFADHVTTPVFPCPQFLLAVSRGMTEVCSAVQPYLQEPDGLFLSLGGRCPGDFEVFLNFCAQFRVCILRNVHPFFFNFFFLKVLRSKKPWLYFLVASLPL